ncbi:MAG TPA: ABC transporter permease [Cyclobacteriaceae bacterium]|nr:ABC transporter permease [Cyclobacteriaceae bacterium]
MLKSILTTALRNIFRNKSFSIINLIGLSVSMSLSMLIILIVKEQLTFDNFHQDGDRIYRVNTNAIRVEGGSEPYASSPLPLAHVLKEEYSFAETVVSINRRLNGDATYGNINVPMRGLIVDPSFLQVFNFQLEKGNPATALSQPKNLILTQESAEKLFGTQEALGQTISISGYGDLTITGVLKKFPGKTHFEFEALASTTAIPIWEKDGILGASTDNWNDYYSNYTYFKLKEGKTTEEVSEALAAISKKYYANLKLETRDKGYEFYLQSLAEITPGPGLSNAMGTGMPTFLLIFLGTLAGVVLLMSIFNFTNLMIAKSLTRAREIGVRKVVGAKRFQVFFQFVGETVTFALIALVFSYVLFQFLKVGYLQLPLNQEFTMSLEEDFSLYLIFVVFAIIVGIVAGLLPAGYLSAFRPLQVLKDSGNVKVYSRLTFRKVLMVTQFTFSVIFVVVVLVIYRQIDYMLDADYGFKQENILNVRLQGMEFEKMANEVRNLSGVVNVGGVSHKLGTWSDRSSDYKRNREDKPFVMRDFIVDDNYINNLELNFVAGKNFDASVQGKHERHVILNETALSQFNFSNAVAAIGQPIYVDDSVALEVIGVVKDFHFRPLSYQIGPVALRYNKQQLGFVSMKIVPSQKEAVIASVESIWKKLDPVHAIEYRMMDQEIDDAYQQSGLDDILVIVGYITFLAVTLACLGMLGMAMYATQTRIKEVGVRKVMGASVNDVVILLSKSFMGLIGIAVILGIPVSIFLGNLFLEQYAYKIEITPLLILSGIFIIAILGLSIICSQTIKAAISNPVKSLRYE